MRIGIHGTCESAKVLATYLEKDNFAVVRDGSGDYDIHLEQDDELDYVIVDGIDCELERKTIVKIEELGVREFRLKRAGGVRSDRAVRIIFPYSLAKQVELGLFRAIAEEMGRKKKEIHEPTPPEKSQARKLAKAAMIPFLIGGLLLLALVSRAYPSELPKYFVRPLPKPVLFQTNFPIVRFMDSSGNVIFAGDQTNDALRIRIVASDIGGGGGTSSSFGAAFPSSGTAAGVKATAAAPTYTEGFMHPFSTDLGGLLRTRCDVGCGGSTFADSAAFTFGTTVVGPFAAVVDDVGTNTVPENGAGTPRMNTNRILYFNPRNNAGTEIATAANPYRIDPTGTTTQPVSGTVAVSNSFLLDATYTGRMPAGASPAENESNTSTDLSRIGTRNFLFDGSSWDRAPGDSTNGAKTNLVAIASTTAATGLGIADVDTLRVAQSQEATYSAGTTAKTATTAGTGVFFNICGSASKTIRIQRFVVSGTVATTAVYADPVLKKTSSATTGGTATTLTNAPYDSNSAAATATVKYYTALGTAGTSVGVIASWTQHMPVTATPAAGSTPPVLWLWRDIDSESPTLRGTAQCMEANFGTTTTNAPTLSVSVSWTEK